MGKGIAVNTDGLQWLRQAFADAIRNSMKSGRSRKPRNERALERDRVCRVDNSQPKRFCDCPELIIDGKRVPCPPHHDCDYVRKRSELVAIADQIASESVGNKRGIVNGYRWTRRFVTEMEKLAAPLLKNGAQAAPERCKFSL